jgi:alpha-galactosidase
MDYELLSRMQLQSTSDQQDVARYPAIAVAAPLSVAPEQCANWAYPQPEMDPEEAAASLVTGLAGRLYLSGHLDRMNPDQLAQVTAAVAVHRELRGFLGTATPRWPLGLPGWEDPWLALELAGAEHSVLHLWHRHPGPGRITLTFPRLRGQPLEISTIFPTRLPPWDTRWDATTATLEIIPAASTSALSARTFRLTPVPR